MGITTEVVSEATSALTPFNAQLAQVGAVAAGVTGELAESSAAGRQFKTVIDGLQSKKITITTHFVNIGTPPGPLIPGAGTSGGAGTGPYQHGGQFVVQGPTGPDNVPRTLDHADVDWINDSVKPMLLAVPPRRAAELALSIAEAVDRAVAALPDEYVALNASAGSPINLLRAEHRREHLDEIERALACRAA